MGKIDTKSCFWGKKINEIDKPLARMTKEKGEMQIAKARTRRAFPTLTEAKRLMGDTENDRDLAHEVTPVKWTNPKQNYGNSLRKKRKH